jgi:hypothetical protein
LSSAAEGSDPRGPHGTHTTLPPDDKRALREEIKVRINAYLTKGQVIEVYFEKFFLQVIQ